MKSFTPHPDMGCISDKTLMVVKSCAVEFIIREFQLSGWNLLFIRPNGERFRFDLNDVELVALIETMMVARRLVKLEKLA